MPLRTLLPSICLPILALLLAGSALAATHTWPGTPPCAGVLQACINAAADNDRIEIATDTPITVSVGVQNKHLTLTAADGYSPVFQNAYVTVYNSDYDGDIGLNLSRIRFEGGHVSASYTGTGNARFDFRELSISQPSGKPGIQVDANSGTVDAMLYDNRIDGSPPFYWGGLIDLRSRNGGTLHARAYYNHVMRTTAGDGGGAGIYAQYYGSGSDGSVKLHGNTVRGSFRTGSITLAEGSPDFPSPVSFDARVYNNVVIGGGKTLDLGIRLGLSHGQIDAQLINNTVTRVQTAIDAGHWTVDGTDGQLSGMLYNNLLVAAQAIHIAPVVVAGITNSNNLVNGNVFGITMDASTLTAPARLNGQNDARLAPDSPAIDAGDNAALGLGLIFNGLPSTDADGLRRFKKKTPATIGDGRVDIGAYEYGDFSFSHAVTADNRSGHITSLTHPAINDQSGANLFATSHYISGVTLESGQPIGSWEFSGVWSLYNKNSTIDMPLSARYNVFAAGAGSGVSRHTTTADNTTNASSALDLTDNPDLIVFAMQNYNTGAAANPRHTGVLYFALLGSGAWYVTNLDTTQAMPLNVGFSIYAQLPSPNVFRATATAGNMIGSDAMRLDHPLLNGNPCAQPVITRMLTHVDGSDFDMEYSTSESRWQIYDYNGMPVGSRFHVLVNPAQAETCGGPLFSDGFE